MGSDTLEVKGFLVRVTARTETDRNFLRALRRRHPEVFESPERPLGTTVFIIKNTGLGLFVLDRLYERFQPFCEVQVLIPFSRWMLPKKVKEVVEKGWKKISKNLRRELEGVRYAPRIIAISRSE